MAIATAVEIGGRLPVASISRRKKAAKRRITRRRMASPSLPRCKISIESVRTTRGRSWRRAR
ncbi:MAG: hypothetical protein QM820_01220 [Minicystis sp.]